MWKSGAHHAFSTPLRGLLDRFQHVLLLTVTFRLLTSWRTGPMFGADLGSALAPAPCAGLQQDKLPAALNPPGHLSSWCLCCALPQAHSMVPTWLLGQPLSTFRCQCPYHLQQKMFLGGACSIYPGCYCLFFSHFSNLREGTLSFSFYWHLEQSLISCRRKAAQVGTTEASIYYPLS